MSSDDSDRSRAQVIGGYARTIEDPGGSKTYSYAYLTVLFAVIVAGLAASIYLGIVTPDVDVTATLSIGWILEYTVAGIVVLFFFWTAAQIANVVGMSFVGGTIGLVARIADNYELPNQADAGGGGGDDEG
jgi:hypothetical protein